MRDYQFSNISKLWIPAIIKPCPTTREIINFPTFLSFEFPPLSNLVLQHVRISIFQHFWALNSHHYQTLSYNTWEYQFSYISELWIPAIIKPCPATHEINNFPGFRIRIRIRINLSCGIRIRIQIADPDPDPGGQKWPTKIEKRTEFFFFLSAGCSLLRAQGFSCSLGVLYGGLGISKWQFLIKKIKN